MAALELDDGRIVTVGAPAVGGSKNETRFGTIDSCAVVLKIQGVHGNVRNEERALRYLARVGIRAPRVVGSGTSFDGRPFLVMSHEAGSHTETPEGWARFGRDLAALAEVPSDGSPFPSISVTDFVADHYRRLDVVRSLLANDLADEITAAIAHVGTTARSVITHGDPGTGNYLDSGDDASPGILLDWESPSVSPFGLDLGRSVFIALLDLRQSGIPDVLASAVLRSYRERSAHASQLTEEFVRAWVTVAGLQFIHGRLARPLMAERTANAAAEALARYLTVG